MKVLAIQIQAETGKMQENYNRAFSLLELGVKLYQPDVVLLPEAFAAYASSTDVNTIAEDVPGPTTDRFCSYSREFGIMVVFGLIRRNPAGKGFYNTVVLIDQGEIIGTYDKTHLVMEHRPEIRALQNEQELFLPGSKLGLFDTRFGKIGVLICHDGEFPEVWRCLALKGAKAVFWLLNGPGVAPWANLHSRWNTVPIFACDKVTRLANGRRVGGNSIFVNIHGEPFDFAGSAESFVFGDVDLDEQTKFRNEGRTPQANIYRVRRTDLYDPVCWKTPPKDE